MYESMEDAQNDNGQHIGILTTSEHMPTAATRKPSLETSTQKAIDVISQINVTILSLIVSPNS